MIRIDPETGEAEIVVSGVRNPWRYAFDDDGSLWVADVGQQEIEEINHLTPDEIDGANLGWSGFEGSKPYLDGDGRRPGAAIGPVFEYSHDNGNCSITGGFVYRGTAIAGLEGRSCSPTTALARSGRSPSPTTACSTASWTSASRWPTRSRSGPMLTASPSSCRPAATSCASSPPDPRIP